MSDEMSDAEAAEFYADPANREPQGPPRKRKLILLPGRQDVEVVCSMCEVEFSATFFYDPEQARYTKAEVRAMAEAMWQDAHDEEGDCKFPITVNEVDEQP